MKVPCKRKPETHGHHEQGEPCPSCPQLKTYHPSEIRVTIGEVECVPFEYDGPVYIGEP